MNLLIDPVFQVMRHSGRETVTLPELLARLGRDEVDALPGLQRHQVDTIHIFLCYLAANVLVAQGRDRAVQDADFWLDGIRRITDRADDDAWTLVVDDTTRPAFMQPPLPVGSSKTFDKPKGDSPDVLDVLLTAKNHDVKMARGQPEEAEAWVYAIIGYQTASGYLGKGNYGITRMNSGFGSRVCVGWLEDDRFGTRFARETEVLVSHRTQLLRPPFGYSASGHRLLWLSPWDGTDSFAFDELDPLFIEVARLIRLFSCSDGAVSARGAPTSAPRIISLKEAPGNVGDPWIPINRKTNGALTPTAAGFTPELLRNLIFSKDSYAPAVMQTPTAGATPGWFYASVLVRGQGTTDGFHVARVWVPGEAKLALLAGGQQHDRLANLSKRALDAAGMLRNRVLRPALRSLLQGGPETVAMGKHEIEGWVEQLSRQYEQFWSQRYFEWLWQTVDGGEERDCLRQWLIILRDIAVAVLREAIAAAPGRHGRAYRARVRSEGLFFGAFRKNFSDMMEVSDAVQS